MTRRARVSSLPFLGTRNSLVRACSDKTDTTSTGTTRDVDIEAFHAPHAVGRQAVVRHERAVQATGAVSLICAPECN